MGIAVAVMPESGAPQVGITITGLDSVNPSTITVQVSSDGGTVWTPVRGADHLTTTGAAFVRDFVPGLNVPLIYELVVHAGATTPTPTRASITVPSAYTWVQDPLYPESAVAVECLPSVANPMMLDDSFASLTRSQAWDVAVVDGSRTPVASVGIRQVPSRIPLHLRTKPETQAAATTALRRLLELAGVLVLRGLPPAVPLDAVAHVVAGSVEERPVVGGLLGARNDWLLEVTQVHATTSAVAVPWFTYASVFAAWAPDTYADAMAARPGATYLDWLRDPRRP